MTELKKDAWQRLKESEFPVCIYGTGNACEKILDIFKEKKITCAGIFASDDFVRDRYFKDFKVQSLSQLEQKFGRITVCCAFGSSLPDVMQNISLISQKHQLIFPDLPIAGDKFISKDGLRKHAATAKSVYDRLADEQSKRVFDAVLKSRYYGDITLLDKVFTDPYSDFLQLIRPKPNEVYADLGAYNGDTAQKYIDSLKGNYKYIFLFEPDKRSFRKCVRRLIGYDNISFINACAWDTDTQVGFSQSSGRQSAVSETGGLCAAKRLDSALSGEKCDIIKIDVEGAEMRALTGAAKTIRKYRPRLAVSAYHRPYDIIFLCLDILTMREDYSIYLRQPPYYPAWDTMIYAI